MKHIIVLLIVLVVLFCGYMLTRKKRENLCSTCSGGVSDEIKLLPITDPAFNLRETSKQMILLEDHLANKGKTCHQCIKKHCLSIEGYLEEALGLDSNAQYSSEINSILNEFRNMEKNYVQGEDLNVLSQELRNIRKQLHTKYFFIGLV